VPGFGYLPGEIDRQEAFSRPRANSLLPYCGAIQITSPSSLKSTTPAG